MAKTLTIDFVSDVVCPWCAIGLRGLEIALESIGDAVDAKITFHPFELNPHMPKDGQNYLEHITAKYGISLDEVHTNRARIRTRAADVGFAINTSDASRIYNTFDAHRLLAWAKEKGKQIELKRQLLAAYFTEQTDLSNLEVLVAAAVKASLDGNEARDLLASDRFADEVRREEAMWSSRGVNSVPAVIIDNRYLIAGGQPPGEFELQLRAIMAGTS